MKYEKPNINAIAFATFAIQQVDKGNIASFDGVSKLTQNAYEADE